MSNVRELRPRTQTNDPPTNPRTVPAGMISDEKGREMLNNLADDAFADQDEAIIEVDRDGNVFPSGYGPRSNGQSGSLLVDPKGEYSERRLGANKKLLVLGPDLTRPRMRVELEKLKLAFPQFKLIASISHHFSQRIAAIQ